MFVARGEPSRQSPERAGAGAQVVHPHGYDATVEPERQLRTVLILDERRLILDALQALIAASGRFGVIAYDPRRVDAGRIAALAPDIVLVGVGSQARPLRVLEELHRLFPHIQTVIIADAQDPELIRCVLDNGVSGLVLTDSAADDLTLTLEQVLRGQTALPAGWQTVLSDPNEDPVGSLSQRQLDVLRLLAEGCSNEEIASRLIITVNTVKFHVRSIYMRLGVANRIAARKLLEAHEPRHTRAGSRYP